MDRYLRHSFSILSRSLHLERGRVRVVIPAAAQMRYAGADATTQNEPVESPPCKVVYGCMRQVKTSPMKLNLVAKLIRGMSIADAIAQIEFSPKKASRFVLTTLHDTQRRAVELHGIDPLNMHVAASYVGKGHYLKRIRYHGKGMHGKMSKYYAHYFLQLQDGPPPPKKKAPEDRGHYKTRRLIEAGPRTIPNSL